MIQSRKFFKIWKNSRMIFGKIIYYFIMANRESIIRVYSCCI
nr:MAG TPA: hypothetical protein [Bacteriophage sp.]